MIIKSTFIHLMAIPFVLSLALNRQVAFAQADFTGKTPVTINLSMFGASPSNSSLQNTWAIIKAVNYIKNKWDQNGDVLMSSSSPNIDYANNKYARLEINPGVYHIAPEISLMTGPYSGYYQNSTISVPDFLLPYNSIFGVSANNNEGILIQANYSYYVLDATPAFGYMYRTQNYYSLPLFQFDDLVNPIDGIEIIGTGAGVIFKYEDNLHVGYIAPNGTDLGSAPNGSSIYYPNHHSHQASNFAYFRNCRNVRVANLEIDGNANTAHYMGPGPDGYQDGAEGVRLLGTKGASLEHLYIHHMQQDGINLAEEDCTTPTNLLLDDIHCDRNARNALTWATGDHITVTNSTFTNTGIETNTHTGTIYGSSPQAGLDIETNAQCMGPQYLTSNGHFSNCLFANNVGPCVTNDYQNWSMIRTNHVIFDQQCTFQKVDAGYGLVVMGDDVKYENCDINCRVIRVGKGDVAGTETQFVDSRFEDKPYTSIPMAAMYPLIDLTECKRVLFQGCTLTVNDINREFIDLTWGANLQREEYHIFDGNTFIYKNGGLPYSPSHIKNAIFRNHNLIQNIENSAGSYHELLFQNTEVEGSNDPCVPSTLTIEGQVIGLLDGDHDYLYIGRKPNGIDEGYATVQCNGKSLLLAEHNQKRIHIGERSSLVMNQESSFYSRLDNFILENSGQFIVKKNSYVNISGLGAAYTSLSPSTALFYIDENANNGSSVNPFWTNIASWIASTSNWLNGYSTTIATPSTPCVQGGHAQLNSFGCMPIVYKNVSTNGPFSALYNVINVSCNGNNDGELDVQLNGGVGQYDYSIDSQPFITSPSSAISISSLNAGNHILVVKDANGCSITINFTITEPAAVSVNATFTNVSCNGAADGTITTTGSPGSTITINGAPPAANYGPGVYTVVATAPGGNAGLTCTATTTVTITEPIAITVNATFTNVSCNGAADGTITATGSPGSTITINGAPPTANYGPGVYTVVATAPGGNAGQTCTATTTVTIGTDWVNYCCNSEYNVASAPKEHLEGIPYDYAISSHVPALTTYSGYTFFVHNNLMIDQSTTFDHCTFLFTPNSKITVAAGQTLTLITCTLKAGCGAMWDGIYTSGVGSEVVINGGVLQDMENGVVISMQGKLTSDGSTYRDNYQSIQLLGLSSGYTGIIVHSVFEGLNGLITPYNASDRPKHGIVVNGCYHIVIGDESDVSKGNLFEGLQNGIYMEYDASFISAFQQPFVGIYYNRFEGIDQGVGFDSPETIGGASMYEDPEGSAIFGYNKLVKHKITAEIIGNDANSSMYNFDGCTKDIVLNAFNATVLKNFSKHSPGGFLFSQCEGKNIRVSDNVLEDVRLGIANTGNAQAFHCDNNNITVSDDNFSYGIMSTQYSKNTGATLLHYNNITLPNFDYSQGVNIAGGTNDNLIGNLIHFTNNSTQAALTTVPTLAGIKVVNSTNTVFENNTIEGLSSPNFLSNRRTTGFYLHKCTQATIDCNIARDMQFGMYVVGDNKTGAYDRVKNNLFSSTTANLLFRHLSNEGSLGDIGLNQFTPFNYHYDANNKFYTPSSTPINLAHLYRLSLTSAIANGDRLVTASATLNQNSPLASSSNISGHQYLVYNPPSFDETYNCTSPNTAACNYSTPNTDLPDMRDAIAIAMQAQQYLEYPDGGKWLDERFLYEWLNLDTSLTAQFPILDSFYEANNGDVLGSLWEVDNMLSQLTDSTQLEAEEDWDELLLATRMANEALDESLIFAERAKWINGLFLNYLEYGLDVIDSLLRTEIYTLAIQCPYQMGEAVFKARDMVAMLLPGVDYDDMEICNGQGVYKGGSSLYSQENALLNQSSIGSTDSLDYLTVYPNPLRDELYISHHLLTQLRATFKLFDITGKLCFTQQFERDLSLMHIKLNILPKGMYLYEYTLENGVSYHGKLLVE